MKFYAPIQKDGFTASPRGEFVKLKHLIDELESIAKTPDYLEGPFLNFCTQLAGQVINRESAPRHYEEEEG
jgi:hypothetical protein